MTPAKEGGKREPGAPARWVIAEVEVVGASFDPTIDGPSNAMALCAGICTRGALLLLAGAEIAWVAGQLLARWLLGRCIDPPPFVLLHRMNLVLVVMMLLLVLRAGRDVRSRQRARLQRERQRLAKAEEVRAAIAEDSKKRLRTEAISRLH